MMIYNELHLRDELERPCENMGEIEFINVKKIVILAIKEIKMYRRQNKARLIMTAKSRCQENEATTSNLE